MKKTTALFFLTFILTNHAAQNALGALALVQNKGSKIDYVSTQPGRNYTISLPSTPSYLEDCAKDCEQDAGDCASVCWDLLCGCFTGEETDQAPSVPVVSDQDVFTAALALQGVSTQQPLPFASNIMGVLNTAAHREPNIPLSAITLDPSKTPATWTPEQRFLFVLYSGVGGVTGPNPRPVTSYATIIQWMYRSNTAGKNPVSFTGSDPVTNAVNDFSKFVSAVNVALIQGKPLPSVPDSISTIDTNTWESLLLAAQQGHY